MKRKFYNTSVWVIKKDKYGVYWGMDKGAVVFMLGYGSLNSRLYTRYYRSPTAAANRIDYLKRRGYDTEKWYIEELPLA